MSKYKSVHDWNSKPITKDMARKPRKKLDLDSEERTVIRTILFIGTPVIFFAMISMFLFSRPKPATSTQVVSQNMPHSEPNESALLVVSNTPLPSPTEKPTKTPFPTFTPTKTKTEAPKSNLTVLQPSPYPTYTAYPTYTPQKEDTKTPNPTLTNTPEPTEKPAGILAIENDIRNKMRMDNLKVDLLETLSSKVMVFMYALLILVFVSWLAVRNIISLSAKERRSVSSVQVAREVNNQVPINDWRDHERRNKIIELREQGANLSYIEGEVWPNAKSRGGSYFKFIKSVLKNYDPLGEYGPTTPPPNRLTTLKSSY